MMKGYTSLTLRKKDVSDFMKFKNSYLKQSKKRMLTMDFFEFCIQKAKEKINEEEVKKENAEVMEVKSNPIVVKEEIKEKIEVEIDDNKTI